MSMPDPLAAVSAPISAYMSGHSSANLAYVKHFGKKPEAVSATFKSLNSRGFIVTYKTADDTEHETFIEYTAPVTKREDLRPVLEAMAKEAESALGMPSSLNGPPPIQALMKAAELEQQQLQQEPEQQQMPFDVFYPVDRFWQITIALGLGTNALLGQGSDDFLARFFPSFVLAFRNYLTHEVTQAIFKWAVAIHIFESVVAFGICLKHGWYSPTNVFKWTTSTLLYGYFSMSKLIAHGKKVNKLKKQ